MKNQFPSKRIERYSFLIFGFVNFLVTNLLLVGLLSIASPTFLASGLAVLFNFILGYFLNRNFVFSRRDWLHKHNKYYMLKYGFVALGSWLIYIICIPLICELLDTTKNIAAITLIPVLTIYSYLMQSRLVFNK
mgnify:CR=1 FL=1